jgi:hypothetical protein
MILYAAEPKDALYFGSTCTNYRAAFQSHMLSMTYRALNKFHLPPKFFMRAMVLTSSIIAGSVATNVVTGDRYEPSTLDIISPASEESSMKNTLHHELGFRLIDVAFPSGMQGSLRMLYEFAKGGKRVRLWSAAGENPTVPLMLAGTTFVMNYISPWSVYCAYPKLTLAQRGLINHFTDGVNGSPNKAPLYRFSSPLDEYTQMGVSFAVDDKVWPDTNKKHKCFVSSTCAHTIRSLYDGAGLRISLPVHFDDGEIEIAEQTRYDRNHTTIWSLGGQSCDDPLLCHKAFALTQELVITVSRAGVVI